MKFKRWFACMLLTFSVIALIQVPNSTVHAEDHTTYYPNITTYPNVRSCNLTDGGGVWTEPVLNTVGHYHGPPFDHGEIGVLEITEENFVFRIEVNGSGCVPPVNLTCNGITKNVTVFHDDASPDGHEVIVFDIPPSKIVTLYSSVHTLAENHGFGIKWIKLYYMSVVTATVDIDPDTLNLRSKGKWITGYIELPGDYNVTDVDVSTILLNDTIPAEMRPVGIGDEDSDGIPDLMVKLDRADVKSYIFANVNMTKLAQERFMTITLTITGTLTDGTPFQGSDKIKLVA